MAEIAGKTRQVWIKATVITDGTGAIIEGIDDSSYNLLCDILEISAFGDTHKKRLAGLKDSAIPISGNLYDGDTTGQDLLVPGDTVFVGVYHNGTAAAGLGQVQCIVENVEYGASVEGKQTISASILGIAAPVALPLQTP